LAAALRLLYSWLHAWPGLGREARMRDIGGNGIMGALPLRHGDGLCQEGST
jgi:hypothetical protein